MNKYQSIDDLRVAKGRLYFRKEQLELEIKNNFSDLKHALSPKGLLDTLKGSGKSGAASSANQPPGFMNNIGAIVMDMLVNDIFMRRSGYFKRFFMTYLIRLFGPALIHNAGPVVSSLLKKTGLMDYFNKKSSQNGHPAHDEPVYTHGV